MGPFRRLVQVALDERTKRTVKAGSHVLSTLRNLAAIGAAAASIATGGFLVTRDRAPEPPASAGTAAPLSLLQQLRGPLAFEALFLQDIGTPPPLPTGAAPTASLSTRADGVDFAGPGAYTPLIVRRAVPAKYVAELDLVAQQGTDATLSYSVRSAGTQQYQVAVDVANELVRFQYVDRSVTPVRVTSLIPNAIPATGLSSAVRS